MVDGGRGFRVGGFAALRGCRVEEGGGEVVCLVGRGLGLVCLGFLRRGRLVVEEGGRSDLGLGGFVVLGDARVEEDGSEVVGVTGRDVLGRVGFVGRELERGRLVVFCFPLLREEAGEEGWLGTLAAGEVSGFRLVVEDLVAADGLASVLSVVVSLRFVIVVGDESRVVTGERPWRSLDLVAGRGDFVSRGTT